MTSVTIPELNTAIAHLRDALGDQTYESLARKGETTTTAAMATYALGLAAPPKAPRPSTRRSAWPRRSTSRPTSATTRGSLTSSHRSTPRTGNHTHTKGHPNAGAPLSLAAPPAPVDISRTAVVGTVQLGIHFVAVHWRTWAAAASRAAYGRRPFERRSIGVEGLNGSDSRLAQRSSSHADRHLHTTQDGGGPPPRRIGSTGKYRRNTSNKRHLGVDVTRR